MSYIEEQLAWATQKEQENVKRNETNVEHYLEEILAADDLYIKLLDLMECNPCSKSDVVRWLFDEWKEPVLKDGEGLEIGQTIMVKNECFEQWTRGEFLFYADGKFWCYDVSNEDAAIAWMKARLLKEGER